MKCTNLESDKSNDEKRFSFTNEVISALTELKPPATTISATKIGPKIILKIGEKQKNKSTTSVVPEDIFQNLNTEVLNKWLSYYIVETRNC